MNAWFVDNLAVQLSGVVLASLSSGFGETNFLALCTYYPKSAVYGYFFFFFFFSKNKLIIIIIKRWSSGTGGAGVVGALTYLALTTWFRLEAKTTFLIMSPFPLAMVKLFFLISYSINIFFSLIIFNLRLLLTFS